MLRLQLAAWRVKRRIERKSTPVLRRSRGGLVVSMLQIQRCSTCGRPRLGHKGPLGKKCTMETQAMPQGKLQTLSGLSFASPAKPRETGFDAGTNSDDSISSTSEEEGKANVNPILVELTRQFHELSLVVKKSELRQITMENSLSSLLEQMSGQHVVNSGQHVVSSGMGNTDIAPSGNQGTSTNFNNTQHDFTAFSNTEAGPLDQITLPSGAQVSRRTLKAAKLGEFVHLNEFIPSYEPSRVFEATIIDEKLQIKQKKSSRKLDSFFIWLLAWAGYERTIVDENPSLYDKLSQYRLFIQELDAKYAWSAVVVYDGRNRLRKSLGRSFDFNITDTEFYVNLLEHGKTNVGCFRCKSIMHYVEDCPFRQSETAMAAVKHEEKSARKQQPRASPAGPGGQTARANTPWNVAAATFTPGNQSNSDRYTPVCINFNAGQCKFGQNCTKRHVCSRCGSNEPLPRCKTCNTNATT